MSEPPSLFQSAEQAISVTELNRRARALLEQGLPLLWVRGEISNLSFATSGHLYFTLKDDQAQAGCVMFRSRAQLLGFRPAAGQQVDARVRVTLYETAGRYQLQIETMRPAGQGDLHARFLALRDRLAAEGLFDAGRKRPLPALPRRIGIVTSPRAAALRDVVTTLRRRAPQVDLVVYPAAVQGEAAPAQLIAALRKADARAEVDLLLLCRGGGSIEDLWAFNDETLARTLRDLRLPVVCGVGHETDFTIADFAADLRAPTPTAAAELACPDRADLLRALIERRRRIDSAIRRLLDARAQQLDHRERRLRHPAEALARSRQALAERGRRLLLAARAVLRANASASDALSARWRRIDLRAQRIDPARRALTSEQQRLSRALQTGLATRRDALAALAARLRALDPRAVIDRGYALITDGHGRVISDTHAAELKQPIQVNLRDGRLQATIDKKLPPQWPPDT